MANVFKGGITPVQGSTVTTLTADQRSNAIYSGSLNPIIQNLYSIAIWDLQDKRVYRPSQPIDPAQQARGGASIAEFFFTVPPKMHEMTEPFSTSIVPTQNNGKVIESQGSIMKHIRVQGTTGLRPNKKVPTGNLAAETPVFGSAIAALADEVGTIARLGASAGVDLSREATGFDDIVFLKNIFRTYSDLKQDDAMSRRVVMLWRNIKDGEYWIVEPGEFKFSQSSSSPMTYEYAFPLRTISKLDVTLGSFPPDPLANTRSAQNFFSRVQAVNQSLRKSFLIISAQIDRLSGLGVFANTQILSPILNTLQGLNAIKVSAGTAGDRVRYNAEIMIDNIDEALATLRASDRVPRQDPLVNLLQKTLLQGCNLVSEPSLQNNVGDKAANARLRKASAYIKSGTTVSSVQVTPATGGSKSYLGNEGSSASVGQAVVGLGEDIRALAKRLLGDKNRWQILVVLNDLRAPYISPVERDGALKPGDTILYPIEGTNGLSQDTIGTTKSSSLEKENTDEKLSGPAQEAYGRDIRVKMSASPYGTGLTDLAISQAGDLSTVVGIPNVDQAIRLKFSTEKGELPAHSEYGAAFPIGSKMDGFAANEVYLQTRATIASDTRIGAIRDLQFLAVADAIVLNADLQLTDKSDSLNTNFALRRF